VTFDEQIAWFVGELERWNRHINLTAAATRAEIEAHVADSAPVVQLLGNAQRVLDVGSGGGFPVVIAAASLPRTSFVALEPVHKKHAFLRTIARELTLGNLTVLAERLEDHHDADYDAVMSRATFDLREWHELGLARVRVGGVVIGFEAQLRNDLPPDIERHPYTLGDKTRALITLRRS
jgi:16S rRNA (guanine(527)-N(7))-methyltransferase RsmG